MAPIREHTVAELDEIKLEDIDFDVVKDCTQKEILKKYLKLLGDDGNYYTELVKAVKDKLLEVAPKDYYLLYPRQISQNEVDDITRDLLDWQATVKQTDEALSKSKKNRIWDDPEANVIAPIRGQEPVVSRPNVYRKEEIKDKKNQSGPTGDYARDKTKMKDYYDAWEKIDVDAIEAEFDEEERKAEEARRKHFEDMKDEQDDVHNSFTDFDHDVNDAVPDAHRKHLADSEKEKGNEAFYSKDFDEAEAYYSRSLQYLAEDPSVWANRALARLRLEKFAAALEDCEHALAINPRYMKALHRKGKALYELKRYEEAVQSFQLALIESPGNTQINGDLMVARRKLRHDGPGTSQPKTFAPPPRSKGPNESTCVIEEILDDDEDDCNARKVPDPGYTRVQIEEDSDTEEEMEVERPPMKNDSAGFHKVPIQQEDSDSEEEEGEKEKPPTKNDSAGFHKVPIQEDSDTEEEEGGNEKPLMKSDSAGFHKVPIQECNDSEEDAQDMNFDDMD